MAFALSTKLWVLFVHKLSLHLTDLSGYFLQVLNNKLLLGNDNLGFVLVFTNLRILQLQSFGIGKNKSGNGVACSSGVMYENWSAQDFWHKKYNKEILKSFSIFSCKEKSAVNRICYSYRGVTKKIGLLTT